MSPGETKVATIDLTVGEDAVSGNHPVLATAYAQILDVAGYAHYDNATTTISVQQPGDLALEAQAGTAAPGETYALTYRIENTGSTTIGDGDDSSPTIAPGPLDDPERPLGVVTNEGAGPDDGFIDGFTWSNWTIDPGEALEANLQVELPNDTDPGEYDFTIVANQGTIEGAREYDRASGTVTVTEPAFEFTSDAFPFYNWEGKEPSLSSGGDFDPDHEHIGLDESVFIDEFVTGINNLIPDRLTPPLPDSVLGEWAKSEYENFTDGTFRSGHCFGMVFAAEQYYRSGVPDSVPASSASEIPQPTGEYDTVETDIDEYQNNQAKDFSIWWLGNYAMKYGSIDLESEFSTICDKIDESGVAPVGLGGDGLHQVLAYEYDTSAKELTVYDPNERLNQQPPGLLNLSGETIEFESSRIVYSSGASYDTAVYLDEARPDPLGILIGGLEVVGEVVVEAISEAVDGFVSIVANSPVQIDATAPDGTQLNHPTESIDGTPPEEIVYLTDAPAGKYEITIEGTGSGDYAIETQGAVPNGGQINAKRSGTISEGETQTLTATVPDKEGDSGDINQGNTDDELNLARFDQNETGYLETQDVVNAIVAYNSGDQIGGADVSAQDVVNVIVAFNTGQSV
ncbi:COG1361 family protein [Halorientalis persicus]|uniref:hypothetical protein n=1 Tax=Halorientalis persicus TaxID=1367881 RepID=UPI0011144096|nr:hypothetical protein [Halorientalis persicus]